MILNRYLIILNKGNIFERAKILRDRVPYTNEQGEHKTKMKNPNKLINNKLRFCSVLGRVPIAIGMSPHGHKTKKPPENGWF